MWQEHGIEVLEPHGCSVTKCHVKYKITQRIRRNKMSQNIQYKLLSNTHLKNCCNQVECHSICVPTLPWMMWQELDIKN